MKNGWSEADNVLFCVSYAIRRSPHILKSKRTKANADMVAAEVIAHLERCGYQIVKTAKKSQTL